MWFNLHYGNLKILVSVFINALGNGENQIFLPNFTLLLTCLPLIPTNVMSNSLLKKGSWISPFTITGSPGMPGMSTSIPCLSKRSSFSSIPTLSGKPSSCTTFSKTEKGGVNQVLYCLSSLFFSVLLNRESYNLKHGSNNK